MDKRFSEALASLADSESRVDEVASVISRVFLETAVAVSTLGDPLGTETVSASDAIAARCDEIQIDLAEGPSWEALSGRRPVVESDLHEATTVGWAQTLLAFQSVDLGSVYAFPLIVGPISLGAMTIYSMSPGALTGPQVLDADLLSGVVARRVLGDALLAAEATNSDDDQGGAYSRREVHQATGMIIAQMRISAADALLVLRSHAFTNDRSVMAVAADVVSRLLDFSTPPDEPRTTDD